MRYVATWRYSDNSASGIVPLELDENAVRFIQWWNTHFLMDPHLTIYRVIGQSPGIQTLHLVEQPPECQVLPKGRNE